jgi:hypothetical protein
VLNNRHPGPIVNVCWACVFSSRGRILPSLFCIVLGEIMIYTYCDDLNIAGRSISPNSPAPR